MSGQYWIKTPADENYREVDRAEYVRTERANGFNNTMGRPDEPATSAFKGPDGTQGTTFEPGGSTLLLDSGTSLPDYWINGHNFYDRAGKPISLEEWSSGRHGESRTVSQSRVVLPGSQAAQLVTVWLGFVEPSIYDARLFGTALLYDNGPTMQLETHDTEDQANARHRDHRFAIMAGHHCARCKDGLPHIA